MSTSLDELNRVQLEPIPKDKKGKGRERPEASSEEDDDSDPESAPSDEDPDVDPVYEVDAIKWAKYRDSKRDRQDGRKAWHYGVMWKGFLKSGSETEEFLECFGNDSDDTPIVDEFWKAVGRPIPRGKKEPKGARLEEVIETPKATMKKWLKDARPRRNYRLYVRRRAKEVQREKHRPGPIPEDLITTKADSDYYWNKKIKREKLMAKKAETGKNSRNPSKSVSVGPSISGPSASVRVTSSISSLDSIFNSDREVSMDLDGEYNEGKESTKKPTQSGNSKLKRKKVISSPEVVISATSTVQGKSATIRDASPKKKPKLKLDGLGRIPKKIASTANEVSLVASGASSKADLTFGQLQPGIFDSALTPTPSLPTPIGTAAPAPTDSSNPKTSDQPFPATSKALNLAVETATPPFADVLRTPVSARPPAVRPSPSMTSAPARAPTSARPTGSIPAQPPPVRPPPTSAAINPVSKLLSALQGSCTSPTASTSTTQAPSQQTVRPPIAPSQSGTAASGQLTGWNPDPTAQKLRPDQKAPSLMNREKYVQPSRIQILDNTVDPVTARRLAKLGVQDPHLIVSPSSAPTQSLSPLYTPVSGNSNQPARPSSSAFAPRTQHGSAPQHQPPPPSGQPPPLPPSGPRLDRNTGSGLNAGRQAGPLPEQGTIHQDRIPTWQQRQQVQPRAAAGHLSPNPSYDAGGSLSLDRYVDPNGHLSPRADGSSPSLPGLPFNAPVQSATYMAARDPRLRAQQQAAVSTSVSPAQTTAVLPTSTSATPPSQAQVSVLGSTPANSLRPVESKGGLVTISPLLILRSPDKLHSLMTLLRTSLDWGTYIIPSALVAVDKSWSSKELCPDPTSAYSTLIQYLPLDDTVRQLSGVGISSGSGLSISCCPPSPYAADACVHWKSWLGAIALITDYSELVRRCKGVKSGYFENLAQSRPNDVDEVGVALKEVELAQVQDMAGMRTRRDVMRYTRFLYVGENRIEQGMKDTLGSGIEFMRPEDFAAVLEHEAA